MESADSLMIYHMREETTRLPTKIGPDRFVECRFISVVFVGWSLVLRSATMPNPDNLSLSSVQLYFQSNRDHGRCNYLVPRLNDDMEV